MKELSKKILEAGLIDKTVVQCLVRWNLITPEEAAIAVKPVAVVEALEKFVENLEELLDEEPSGETTDKPFRETKLEITVRDPIDLLYWNDRRPVSMNAYKDEMGRLIVDPEHSVIPGTELLCNHSGKHLYTVEKVEGLYQGPKLIARQLTVSTR